jgi:ATP diphosphatase
MTRLRDPQDGCPWDRDQSFDTIAPYTVEEAYEVADAIARNDLPALRDELGDLLLQVVFHARMAEEQGAFDFGDVAAGISDKMLRRHPHVFGSPEQRARGAEPGSWERIKAEERAGRSRSGEAPSVLDGVALALPALKRAQKLGKRAAATGFDWPDAAAVWDKVAEESAELRAADSPAAALEELGDLLFTVVNLARHLRLDPEAALQAANRKFERRFRHMERSLQADGQSLAELPDEALESAWQRSKRELETGP